MFGELPSSLGTAVPDSSSDHGPRESLPDVKQQESQQCYAQVCACQCIFRINTRQVAIQMGTKLCSLSEPLCSQTLSTCPVIDCDASLRRASAEVLTVKLVYSCGTAFNLSTVARWKHLRFKTWSHHPMNMGDTSKKDIRTHIQPSTLSISLLSPMFQPQWV